MLMESSESKQSEVPQQTAPALEHVPHQWPGMFGMYKYAKQAVQFNLGTNLWLQLFVALVGGALDVALGRNFGGLASLVFGSLFSAALLHAQISGVRGNKVSLEGALSRGIAVWLQMILLTILVGVSLLISFVLLIVPFFFVLPRLTLATYFLVDKQMDVLEAYKASWYATKGHTSMPWGIIVVTILICMLAITIIGIPFTIYFYIMYSAAFAVLYEMLR